MGEILESWKSGNLRFCEVKVSGFQFSALLAHLKAAVRVGIWKVSERRQAVLKRFLMEGARMIHGPSGTSGRFDTLLPVRPHRVSDRSSATALLGCWYRFSPLQAWGPGRCLDRSFQEPRSASRDPLIWQSPRRFVRAYRQILDYGVCTDRADEYLSHYSEINNRNSTLRYRTKHNDNESIQY